MNNETTDLQAGTIKLYQIGRKSKTCSSIPDLIKECEHYSNVTERKRVIKNWLKKYGSTMNYCYLYVIPGKFLSRTTRK